MNKIKSQKLLIESNNLLHDDINLTTSDNIKTQLKQTLGQEQGLGQDLGLEQEQAQVQLKNNNNIKIESYQQMINKIIGKKVLFIDLKTSGLTMNKDQSMPGGYPDYTLNEQYDSSRILQIAWYYCDFFSKELELKITDIKSMIRKPVNFKTIHPKAIEDHGITYEKATSEGVTVNRILNTEFGNRIMECDFIIGYNAYYDFSVLANEIHRIKKIDMYEKMLLLKDSNVICVMKLCELYRGKLCGLDSMYKFLFHEDPYPYPYPFSQQDYAKINNNDVFTMVKILEYICKNPNCPKDEEELRKLREQYIALKKSMCEIESMHKNTSQMIHSIKERLDQIEKSSNIIQLVKKNEIVEKAGSLWDPKEEEQLNELYITKNKSIREIALIHKRTNGAIIARLKKNNILKDCDDPNQLNKYDNNINIFKKNIGINKIDLQQSDDDDVVDDVVGKNRTEENLFTPTKSIFRVVKKNNQNSSKKTSQL